MEELICDVCGKKIEGYNSNHVAYLMSQHMLKHEREEKIKSQNKNNQKGVK